MGKSDNLAVVDDVDALFEAIAADPGAAAAPATPQSAATPAVTANANEPSVDRKQMFQRIGHLTRALHDALRELGYDKKLESAVRTLPDARERLNYIASLTGRAAERVLGAVEAGQALQDGLQRDASGLLGRWGKAKGATAGDDTDLVSDTRVFLDGVTKASTEQNGLLLEIMMAQDFHDLTGQVIKRVGEIAHDLESNLLQLLLETAPPTERIEEGPLSGPVVRPQGRNDVVQNQTEVDALLESLGF